MREKPPTGKRGSSANVRGVRKGIISEKERRDEKGFT